jgi:hypothetical protein
MKLDIDKLSESELVELNRRIIARLRLLQQARTHDKMLEFRIGDRVSFQPDGHPKITGIIAKHNRKTVTVISEGGEHWNVSPGLLSLEKPAGGSGAEDPRVLSFGKNRE